MIPLTKPVSQPPPWVTELGEAIHDVAELLEILQVNPGDLPISTMAARRFSLRVPRAFIARMKLGDPHDPLLRQVLPSANELFQAPGFQWDPVGDLASRVAPGVLHKYHGRVLLVVTGACAVHCRYCFRRHFPYPDENPRSDQWRTALDYIGNDQSISEVILSGGDPLSLNDRRLSELAEVLDDIAHVERLRLHTRLPVVLPSRVDDRLLEWLGKGRLQKIMVIHANHANEIDSAFSAAAARLRAAGVVLFNQSVLLRGVNDRLESLVDLSEKLFSAGVIPYYLHLLDKVEGAEHFDVSESVASGLMAGLARRLPGYMLPRLVRELPGVSAKFPVDFSAELTA